MRVYIGLWLVIIALLVSCVEGSVLVKVFTRFTEEIFASLISLIYIWESLSKCFNVRTYVSIFLVKEKIPSRVNLLVNDSNSTAVDQCI